MLKTLIVLLMIALVASLASGLVFLMSDRGNPNKNACSLRWAFVWASVHAYF